MKTNKKFILLIILLTVLVLLLLYVQAYNFYRSEQTRIEEEYELKRQEQENYLQEIKESMESTEELKNEMRAIKDEITGLVTRAEDLENRLQEQIDYFESLPFEVKGTVDEPVISRGGGVRVKYVDLSDLRVPSGVSAESLDTKAKGTGMEGLGATFVEAENLYSVNAVFLWSLAAQESGWGNSYIAVNKNNLFGFRAYDRASSESATDFDTIEDSIIYVAGYLAHNYFDESGKYYSGTSLSNVHKWSNEKYKYSSDDGWAVKITQIMSRVN